ncbi:hypothetical protein [Sphingopyxis sp. GC21]|nr:hypothetical protein [Sphingopyxis sp. GC21]
MVNRPHVAGVHVSGVLVPGLRAISEEPEYLHVRTAHSEPGFLSSRDS